MSENTQHIKCDIAIIGGGAGGLSVAATAAQLDLQVVLVESSEMGGDCLNSGCVPSKSLLATAKMQWQSQHSQHLGVHENKQAVDFSAVMRHVHGVIHNISEHDSVERFTKLGVKVISAQAEFLDANTLQAGDHIIKARRFVIATGSHAFVPPIPGIDKVDYLTNENIFDLKEQPKHLIVIGGGPIGIELAQAFRMLGSEVTVLEAFKALPKDEVDCVNVIKDQLKSMQVDLLEGIKIKSVSKDPAGVKVTCEDLGKIFDVCGTHLLVATGRRANVAGLGLDNAKVKHSDKGISVNARLQTSNKKISAIGDVIGPYQFTHIASYHAGIVVKNIIFKIPAKVNYQAVPWVTYTDPEIAHVGLLAQDAKNLNIDIQVVESEFKDNDRAQADGHVKGKIKVLTNKKGKILGVTIVGSNAGELITPWVMAIREGKNLRCFTDTIIPYPTLSEISKRAASEFYIPKLFAAKTKAIVSWLIRF